MASAFEQKVANAMNKYSGTIKTSGGTGVATPKMTPSSSSTSSSGSSSSSSSSSSNSTPTPPIYNAATGGGGTPALGYGGATYNSSGSANQAISANESKLKSDENFRNSEIGRTQAVINARKAQGLDTSEQEKYLTVNLGYKPSQSNQQPPGMPAMPQAFTPNYSGTPQIPVFTPTIPSMDWDAIQKYATDQMNAELTRQRSASDQAIAAGKLTADQQTASLRQAAERLRGDITEQRGIENVDNARRLSPFSGRSDYAQGMIERERGKTDRQLTENQQMQEANIAANLAQLQNEINAKYLALEQTSGPERERMIQSLRDSERQYDLQSAQLEIDRNIANSQLRNTDFGQQLASWQANRGAYEFDRNFGLQEGQLTGNYNGSSTLAGKQSNLDAALAYSNLTGKVLTPQADWSGYARQANNPNASPTWQAAQAEWENNFRQGQFDFDKASTLWEQQFQGRKFEQDMKEAAASRGLQWANLSQRQKEFLADQEWREKQFEAEQKAAASGGNTNLNTVIDNVNNLYTAYDSSTGQRTINNQQGLRAYILSLNLPDEQTDQLLLYYGMQPN